MRVSSFDYNHFGMMPAFHVLGLGDSLRRHSLGMLQNLVANFVIIQTLDQSPWHFHTRLRLEK
jgi:hypothetical protein